MRKRYFFIPLIIVVIITGVLVWACKHPFGDGLSFIGINNQGGGTGYLNETGGPGYKGEIGKDVTNTFIKPTQVEVFPYTLAGNYYRIPTLMQLTNGDLLAFADKRKGTIGDLPNSIEVVMKKARITVRLGVRKKELLPKANPKRTVMEMRDLFWIEKEEISLALWLPITVF